MTETFWQNKVYNWRGPQWDWHPSGGEAVIFEPFKSHHPVYCECVAVHGHYAVLYVPKGSHPWFNGMKGEYLVPERLLFPQ